MGRVLLRGGCVLSLDRRIGNLREADVLIENDRIAQVGPGLRARDAEVVDAAGTIVMPGFVDTHRHLWKTLHRNLAVTDDAVPSHAATGDATAPDAATTPDAADPERLGRDLLPDDVYAATMLGLLGAAEAGITTVVDFADIQLDGSYTEASLQAHADAGLRTVLVHAAPAWAEDVAATDAAFHRLVADGPADADATTTLAAGFATLASRHLDDLAAAWASARGLGRRIHVHAGADAAERGRVAEVGARGLLGADVTLVHCCEVDDADLDAIAAHGATVALSPPTEMARGLGPAPLQRMIDRGIRPGLAVDDELMAPGDLISRMRSVQSLQRASVFDRKLAGKAGLPDLLSTREVIRYATVDGAMVAGLGEITGSLVPGKQADIVLLRTDRPNIAPVNDPIGAVVWGMDPSNVDWVFVAGRPLLRAGVLDADVARVRELAVAARQRLATAVADAVLEPSEGGPS